MALEAALGMMTFASRLSDVPFIFTLKPGWADSVGTETKSDCSAAIAELPRSTEETIEFRQPRIISVGACTIGVYVSHPDPSGITVVTEAWNNVVDWTIGANNLNTAATSTGWMFDTQSGVQVCFWEPGVVDRHHMCELPSTYKIKRAIPFTIAICLDIIYSPRAHTSSIGTSNTLSSTVPSTASNVPGSPSPGEDIMIGIRRSVSSWSRPQFSANACFGIVRLLYKAPIATVGRHIFLKYPQIYGNKICTCGFFFTNPPTSGQGMEIDSRGADFQAEALELLMATTMQNGQGGFVDLPNGVQIVIYDSAVDPRNICWLTSKVSLRACINTMVTYHKQDSTTTLMFTATESSATPTSRIANRQ
ncbi:hypothetical protein MMC27_002591 [Xylographa pallens]|nr:hypothetical protein [Xylographa pallens]